MTKNQGRGSMNIVSQASWLYKFFFLWVSISSLMVLLLVEIGVSTKAIYALKDFPVYLAVLVCGVFFCKGRVIYLYLFSALFLFYLFANFIFLNFSYPFPLANIRQIFAPVVVIVFFSSLTLNQKSLESVERFFKCIIYFVVFFGFFELMLSLWEKVDLTHYFNLKGIPVNSEGLSYMFYEPAVGYAKRMTSLFLDPISLGHFLATSFLYFFYRRDRNDFFLLFVILLGVFFTFSKGAVLQLILGLTLLNYLLHPIIRLLSVFIPVIIFILIPVKEGMMIHISGLYNSIVSLSVFGYGIGSVGNYAKMFSSDLSLYNELGISDTFLGSIFGQIGLFGFIFWFSLMIASVFSWSAERKVPAILLFSLVIVSFVSENTMNITSFLGPAILVSLAQSVTLCGQSEIFKKGRYHIGFS